MEVPAEFRSISAGLRCKLLSFLFLAVPALLISCGGDVTIIKTSNADEPGNIAIFSEGAVLENSDGSFSLGVNALVTNMQGNPVENGTPIFFGLIDNYKTAGADGNSAASTNSFSSDSVDFEVSGVVKGDTLIILEGEDKGGYLIKAVESGNLTIDHTFNSDQVDLPFEVGNNYNAYGVVCGSNPTDAANVYTGNWKLDAECKIIEASGSVKGVVHSRLTWYEESIGMPFTLYAVSPGGTAGDVYESIFPDNVAPVISIALEPPSVLAGAQDIVARATLTQSSIAMFNEQVSFTTSNASVADFQGSPSVVGVTDAWGEAVVLLDTYASCTNTSAVITADFYGVEASEALNITGTAPVVDFDIGGADPSYTFTSTSTSPVFATLTCEWDFDEDGITDETLCNATHDYSADGLPPGVYNVDVRLTVTDDTLLACENSTTHALTVTIPEPAP